MKNNGFTLIELLIAIGIVLIMAVSVIPVYGNFHSFSQLEETASLLSQDIRIARIKSLSGVNDSDHGVYFDLNNKKYTLYQGESYALRNSAYDRNVSFSDSISLLLSLSGGVEEINFEKFTGTPNSFGSIGISHEATGNRTVIINSMGFIE